MSWKHPLEGGHDEGPQEVNAGTSHTRGGAEGAGTHTDLGRLWTPRPGRLALPCSVPSDPEPQGILRGHPHLTGTDSSASWPALSSALRLHRQNSHGGRPLQKLEKSPCWLNHKSQKQSSTYTEHGGGHPIISVLRRTTVSSRSVRPSLRKQKQSMKPSMYGLTAGTFPSKVINCI